MKRHLFSKFGVWGRRSHHGEGGCSDHGHRCRQHDDSSEEHSRRFKAGGKMESWGHKLPGGRKFSSEDLQLLLLALLEDRPAHGYELIKLLAQRSNGFYSPSPGMVYPALTFLEEADCVTVTMHGNRKQYALIDAGKEQLEKHRKHVDMMFARLNMIAYKMDRVRRAYAGEEGSVDSDFSPRYSNELMEAFHELKIALFAAHEVTDKQQQQLTDIIRNCAQSVKNCLNNQQKNK